MTKKQGLFITLEGIEGVGKSTCLKHISKLLSGEGIAHLVTREPGGTPFAEEIRQLLLHHHNTPEETISSETELLLLFASRAQHISQVILPALQKGEWVICDRFTDASYAYQGGGRGISKKKISILEEWVQGNFRPDKTLLLDASVTRALGRTKHRKQQDRIEQEKEIFFHKVRKTYLHRAKLYPARFHIINAGRSLSQVKSNIKNILESFIPHWKDEHAN
jgi:dTMP kinase